ncbi:MAG: hypothetical protein A4E69_00101 [Syntrophus sp. PtaB.Bin138]|nr:MAG: hypothetical protein A4E69_00101 [Syntrophus sp. PtaB.Bin138]
MRNESNVTVCGVFRDSPSGHSATASPCSCRAFSSSSTSRQSSGFSRYPCPRLLSTRASVGQESSRSFTFRISRARSRRASIRFPSMSAMTCSMPLPGCRRIPPLPKGRTSTSTWNPSPIGASWTTGWGSPSISSRASALPPMVEWMVTRVESSAMASMSSFLAVAGTINPLPPRICPMRRCASDSSQTLKRVGLSGSMVTRDSERGTLKWRRNPSWDSVTTSSTSPRRNSTDFSGFSSEKIRGWPTSSGRVFSQSK